MGPASSPASLRVLRHLVYPSVGFRGCDDGGKCPIYRTYAIVRTIAVLSVSNGRSPSILVIDGLLWSVLTSWTSPNWSRRGVHAACSFGLGSVWWLVATGLSIRVRSVKPEIFCCGVELARPHPCWLGESGCTLAGSGDARILCPSGCACSTLAVRCGKAGTIMLEFIRSVRVYFIRVHSIQDIGIQQIGTQKE